MGEPYQPADPATAPDDPGPEPTITPVETPLAIFTPEVARVLETPPAMPAHGAHFSSNVGPTRLVRTYMAAWAALMGISAAHNLGAVRLTQRLVDAPLTVPGTDVLAVLDRTRLIGWVEVVATLGLTAVMAVWTYRAYRNLPALGAKHGRYTTKWAIWGWIVPFLNFIRPKQIVDDLWRTSELDAPEEQSLKWMSRRVAGFVHLWWAMQVTTWVASVYFVGVDSESPAGAVRTFQVLAFIDLIHIAYAVLTFWVITTITTRQIRRAAAVYHHPEAVEPEWATSVVQRSAGRARVSAVILVPVIAAVAAVVAWNAFERSLVGGDPSLAGVETINAQELEVGVCFDTPPDLTLIVALPVADCEGAHDYEVFSVVQHATSDQAPYPGESAVFTEARDQCAADFDGYVGVSYVDSALDVLILSPPKASWAGGDRQSVCALYRLDGSQLVGTARDSGW